MGFVAPRLDVVRIGYRQGSLAPMSTQFPAGALIATSAPRSEKPTFVPACLKPATAMTPGQFAGLVTAWPVPLPAETTTTAPAAATSFNTLMYAWVHSPSPPKLRLRTRAGVGLAGTPATGNPTAQRMAATMSESNPPHLPSTRT